MSVHVVKYACCQIRQVIVFVIIGNGIVSMDVVFSGCEAEVVSSPYVFVGQLPDDGEKICRNMSY